MAILIDANTKVLCQGITGSYGGQHAKGCYLYGTQLVGGVTPGKGGQKFEVDAGGGASVPVFDTVKQAVDATGATATMIFVPPGGAADAILEAADAGIRVICAITEGIPVNDMVKARAVLDEMNAGRAEGEKIILVGPNCPGVITPGKKTGAGDKSSDVFTSKAKGGGGCKIGIMPGYIHTHISESKRGKAVGIVSRSGTLTYQALYELKLQDIGVTTCVGIGGDPVPGTSFIDCLERFEADPDTSAVMMIGEIGGSAEEEAADFIASKMTKPVVAYIAGQTAPAGKKMGHAGAIVSGGKGTAAAKMEALGSAGVQVGANPTEAGSLMVDVVRSLA